MNTSEKGARVERIAATWLRAQGYTVHKMQRTTYRRGGQVRSSGMDAFGCIDLLAKRPGESMRLVQVTASRTIGERINKLSAIPWDAHLESVELWRWVSRRGRPRNDGSTRYFQVYRHANGFKPVKGDRVHPRGAGTAQSPIPPSASAPAWPTSTSPIG